jgi:arginine N-succinyltransferase
MNSIPIIRPAGMNDLKTFERLAAKTYGFTTLVNNRKFLEERLESCVNTFKEHIKIPLETYLFVLEVSGETIGISGIISRIGITEPFYAYHLLSEGQTSKILNIQRDILVLHFIQAKKKPTEICSLFLDPQYRGQNFGKFLSYCRFIFIACHRKRFASIVIGDLRGYSTEQGISPFWDAIGRHFFGLNFPEANFLRVTQPECIEELFPKHPIYPLLLPQEAQKAIGLPHPETTRAWKILQRQGFILSHYIDLFDAGPHIYAHTDEIDICKNSRVVKIGQISETAGTLKNTLIANEKFQLFRASIGDLSLNEHQEAILSKSMASALNVDVGDSIRFYVLEK